MQTGYLPYRKIYERGKQIVSAFFSRRAIDRIFGAPVSETRHKDFVRQEYTTGKYEYILYFKCDIIADNDTKENETCAES